MLRKCIGSHPGKDIQVAKLTPLLRWEEADSAPHGAAEILDGLDLTWRFITSYLVRGSPNDAITEDDSQSRQAIWGLLDHDLPHTGELSLLMGADGLPGVEI